MFYSQDIESTHILSEEESQHAIRVLRMRAGDELDVTDGLGHLFRCRITNPSQHRCGVEIISTETIPSTHNGWVHVAVAPTKNIDRIEWMLEKATEMGVDEVTMLLCDHSERKTVNMERLQKIVVAAAKQSLRTTYPMLHGMTTIEQLPVQPSDAQCYIAHCEDGYAASDSKHSLYHSLERGRNTLVLIGPEGDFSPREIAWALANGYQPVSLGPSRLRTETAALAAAHMALLVNE